MRNRDYEASYYVVFSIPTVSSSLSG